MARIVVFSPHQDDESLNCGGTIHNLVKLGHHVQIIFLTDGSRSHLVELGIGCNPTPLELIDIRRAEALSACSILGVAESDIFFLNYTDGMLSEKLEEATSSIKKLILASHLPPLIFICPHENDLHVDHRATSIICQKVANFFSRIPSSYYFVTWGKNKPEMNLVEVNISDCLHIKKRAIEEYKSQVAMIYNSQHRPILDKAMVKSFICNTECFFTNDKFNMLINLLSQESDDEKM